MIGEARATDNQFWQVVNCIGVVEGSDSKWSTMGRRESFRRCLDRNY